MSLNLFALVVLVLGGCAVIASIARVLRIETGALRKFPDTAGGH